MLHSIEDRGETDRVTVNTTVQTSIPTLTLIYDLTFNPRRAMVMIYAHAKIKVEGQFVQTGQNGNRRTDEHDRLKYLPR